MRYRHPDHLLDGLTNEQWDDMLIWWSFEPHGEQRADLRIANQSAIVTSPYRKKGKKVELKDFALNFDRQTGSATYEDDVATYFRETAGMSVEERVAWEKENVELDMSGLTEEDRLALEEQRRGAQG